MTKKVIVTMCGNGGFMSGYGGMFSDLSWVGGTGPGLDEWPLDEWGCISTDAYGG